MLFSHEQKPIGLSSASITIRLYHRHASSQNYYYTRHLNDLLEQIVTPATLKHDDQTLIDTEQEILKRYYHHKQYPTKMRAVNEYYHYHREIPSIFHKEVEELHVRWRQKRQKLLYRQLKNFFNMEQSTTTKRPGRQTPEDNVDVSQLLKEISEYNPQSKNYYIRKTVKSRVSKFNGDCSSLESIQRDLNSILSKCSFVNDLSEIDSKQTKKFEVKPTSRDKLSTAYNFRKKIIEPEKVQEIKLGDKIVLNFHPTFNAEKKKSNSNIFIKIRGARCMSVEKINSGREDVARNNNKPIPSNNEKINDNDSKLRIRMHKGNSKSIGKLRQQKMSSMELKRTKKEQELTDSKLVLRLKSHQSEHVDFRSYKSSNITKKQQRNFLTLNIEPRPIRPLSIQKTRSTMGVKLRGV